MKRIILFAAAIAIALSTSSCDDDKNGPLPSSAKISIRADKGALNAPANQSRANEEHLSALEIVKQTHAMWFSNKAVYPNWPFLVYGFSEPQHDYANERLLMWADAIYAEDRGGGYNPNFIEGEDIVLVRLLEVYNDRPSLFDTIAYIPNSILRTAQPILKDACDRKDFDTLYKLFDEAFRFRPITGPEWRELKEQGLN